MGCGRTGLILFALATSMPATAFEVCRADDGRVTIPVWTPTVEKGNEVKTAPPMRDGLLVYIHIEQDIPPKDCDGKKLMTFTIPGKSGGLQVNVRGNTSVATFTRLCVQSGIFMNEPVWGSAQGWTETYFGAVSKFQVAASGRFCLEREP